MEVEAELNNLLIQNATPEQDEVGAILKYADCCPSIIVLREGVYTHRISLEVDSAGMIQVVIREFPRSDDRNKHVVSLFNTRS